MWSPSLPSVVEKKRSGGAVAVAINTSKGSQSAFKWALENLLSNGQLVFLIHVSRASSSGYSPPPQNKDIFLPFRCFARRKDVKCKDIVLEENNIAKALIDYVSCYSIEHLVMGVPTKPNFLRFKTTEIQYTVSKEAPDFCTVYIISKGKISTIRPSTRSAPRSSLTREITDMSEPTSPIPYNYYRGVAVCLPESPLNIPQQYIWAQQPTHRGRTSSASTLSTSSDSSNVFSQNSSSPTRRRQISNGGNDCYIISPNSSSCYTSTRPGVYDSRSTAPWLPDSVDSSFASSPPDCSSVYHCSDDSISPPSSPTGDAESKMIRRLKQELKQTMDLYNAACKEAVLAKQVAQELERSNKVQQDEERRSRMGGEAINNKIMGKSNNKSEYNKAAGSPRRLMRNQIQRSAVIRRDRLGDDVVEVQQLSINKSNFIYTIEEIEAATGFFSKTNKIGEGVYGPVFKGFSDHNLPVAIRILHPNVAQDMSQFQQEVEALSSLRHPNLVLLLGACPQYGCLVHEYITGGSLEDLLFSKGKTSSSLSWQLRFKIAAEIATALSFLHQNKPEPLVHRDLKPANILITEDFTSKISDVGLARLVPPNVSDSITQSQLTSIKSTFCYVDPEYQQTGILGVKSDVYALGIILLQLITAKPAMGLRLRVESAVENENLSQVLDPLVSDWPLEETLGFAKLALKCSKLRRKNRPELEPVVVPELNRLRRLAEESMHPTGQVSMCLGLLSPPPPSMLSPTPSSNNLADDNISEDFTY